MSLSERDGLTRRTYDRLLEVAETYREALVVGLCGEAGLRPTEIAALTPAAIGKHDGAPGCLLGVSTPDGARDRTAYLPERLARDLGRYVRSNDIDDEERIFDVTPRRLQMLVAGLADRAGERFDDPELAAVSTSDLRRFFARTALVERGLNPRVVKAVGGWQSFEALEPYLPAPTDEEIVRTFARAKGERGAGVADPTVRFETADTDRLEREIAVLERHRAVAEAILGASTHDELEAEACTALTADEPYAAAWIDRTAFVGHAGVRAEEWRTTAGITTDEIDRLEPSVVAPQSEPPSVEESVTGVAAGDRFEGALATVPIRFGDTVYGTLTVISERPAAFAGSSGASLETLGRQLGHAVAAIRRRNLLLSDTLVELEFRIRDDRSFFVDAANRLHCRFELDSLVPVSETTQLYYVHLEGASPTDVFELAEADSGIDDCRLIETYEDGWRVEFVVEGSSPTLTLTEYGVTVTETVVDEGVATITAECAADADIRTIVGGLRSAFPTSELVGKREVERSVQTAREFREGLEERLTDRQEATLRAAYVGGYYDWPRESTAEELADAMGISSPTLHNHLRKGQYELLRTFFDADAVEGVSRERDPSER